MDARYSQLARQTLFSSAATPKQQHVASYGQQGGYLSGAPQPLGRSFGGALLSTPVQQHFGQKHTPGSYGHYAAAPLMLPESQQQQTLSGSQSGGGLDRGWCVQGKRERCHKSR